jgi:hypothetical protein
MPNQNNQHNNKEIADRRRIIAARYLKGEWMGDIATSMGVSIATVSRDISWMVKAWTKDAIADIDKKKGIELSKIDQLEITYWDAWKRSQQPIETVVQEGIGIVPAAPARPAGPPTQALPAAPASLATKMRQTIKTEQQVGSAVFLAGVQWCIEKRCEIIGLNAPKNVDLTSKGKALIPAADLIAALREADKEK